MQRPSDFVARYGGEEFAMLLPDTPLTGAMQMAGRTLEAARRLDFDGSLAGQGITVSIGVAVTTEHRAREPAGLIALADQRLYAAKMAGRNRVVSVEQLSPV